MCLELSKAYGNGWAKLGSFAMCTLYTNKFTNLDWAFNMQTLYILVNMVFCSNQLKNTKTSVRICTVWVQVLSYRERVWK